MEKTRHYCFDVDGVVADFNTAFADLCRRYGASVPHGPPTTWDWVPVQCEDVAFTYVRDHPRWWLSLSPIPGLDEAGLRELVRRHDVSFLTARDASSRITTRWLWEKLAVRAPVITVSEWRDKIHVLRGLRADGFADDHGETISLARSCLGPETESVLIAQPWNTGTERINELIKRWTWT